MGKATKVRRLSLAQFAKVAGAAVSAANDGIATISGTMARVLVHAGIRTIDPTCASIDVKRRDGMSERLKGLACDAFAATTLAQYASWVHTILRACVADETFRARCVAWVADIDAETSARALYDDARAINGNGSKTGKGKAKGTRADAEREALKAAVKAFLASLDRRIAKDGRIRRATVISNAGIAPEVMALGK